MALEEENVTLKETIVKQRKELELMEDRRKELELDVMRDETEKKGNSIETFEHVSQVIPLVGTSVHTGMEVHKPLCVDKYIGIVHATEHGRMCTPAKAAMCTQT